LKEFDPETGANVLEATCLANVRDVYGTVLEVDRNWYVRPGQGQCSLGTIKPVLIHQVRFQWSDLYSKWEYRIVFADASGARFDLSVTDLSVRYLLERWRGVEGLHPAAAASRLLRQVNDGRLIYLRLGLARQFGDPLRCFLQVTGIHTFPDFLGGLCHKDLKVQESFKLDDLHF
jgi:hypothetical protein